MRELSLSAIAFPEKLRFSQPVVSISVKKGRK